MYFHDSFYYENQQHCYTQDILPYTDLPFMKSALSDSSLPLTNIASRHYLCMHTQK